MHKRIAFYILIQVYMLSCVSTWTQSLADEDYLSVLEAVTTAKKAGAETYSRSLYKEAKEDLEAALAARETDPPRSRKLLLSAREKALRSLDETAKSVHSIYIEPLFNLEERLDSLLARSYFPVEYASCISEANLARNLYEANDIGGALLSGKKASEDISSLLSQIEDSLAWIRILLSDIETGLDRMEKNESDSEGGNAEIIIAAYFDGFGGLADYDLERAQEAFTLARSVMKGEDITSKEELRRAGMQLFGNKKAGDPRKKAYTYRVLSIPENRQTLWSIAGSKEAYADPFLWPIIWRNNMDAIPNPAFILPGTMLVIPPLPAGK